MKNLLLKAVLALLIAQISLIQTVHAQWIPNTSDATNLELDETSYNSVNIGDPGTTALPSKLTVAPSNANQNGVYAILNSDFNAIMGIVGPGGSGTGVFGSSGSGTGVYGYSFSDKGVHGYCNGSGYAGYFEGDKTYVSGNLGVGVANPLEKLHVNGSIRGNALGGATRFQTTYGYVEIAPRNQHDWAHFMTDQSRYYFNKAIHVDGGRIGSHWNQNLHLRVGNNTRIFVKGNSTGYVGIGTSNPTEKLHVNGNLYTTGSYVGSDLRLKQDVQELQYGLKEVLALKPLTYDYNGKGGTESGHFNVGIFAQDLQEIAPEFVSEFTHKVLETTEEVNGEGEIESRDEVVGEETYLKIYDTGIKYMLINAIKEQQTIIDNQQSQIDELRDMVSKLTGNQQEMILEGTQGYLQQNQPNPFSENTLIKYFIADGIASAVVNVYDVNGKLIHKERITQTGAGEIQLKSKNLTAGTYSYSLILDGRLTDTKQMVIK